MARNTSFYYSFLVLPAAQRRAMLAVWDFCRAVDDLHVGATADHALDFGECHVFARLGVIEPAIRIAFDANCFVWHGFSSTSDIDRRACNRGVLASL